MVASVVERQCSRPCLWLDRAMVFILRHTPLLLPPEIQQLGAIERRCNLSGCCRIVLRPCSKSLLPLEIMSSGSLLMQNICSDFPIIFCSVETNMFVCLAISQGWLCDLHARDAPAANGSKWWSKLLWAWFCRNKPSKCTSALCEYVHCSSSH